MLLVTLDLPDRRTAGPDSMLKKLVDLWVSDALAVRFHNYIYPPPCLPARPQ